MSMWLGRVSEMLFMQQISFQPAGTYNIRAKIYTEMHKQTAHSNARSHLNAWSQSQEEYTTIHTTFTCR